MTKKLALILALLGMLAACGEGTGTNPVYNGPEDEDGETPELPPGTDEPTADDDIVRYDDSADALASDIQFNAENDTFSVNGLAFDGTTETPYNRGVAVSDLGPYRVYENVASVTDPNTGAQVPQLQHRAIYGESASGKTSFAIVRTGGYVDYGFGGFVYMRNGGVTLPTAGQGNYTGDYAGIRDFEGRSGVEYSVGKMDIFIDFEDFNDPTGIRGTVSDRRIFDDQGNDITQSVVVAFADAGYTDTELPVMQFKVGPSVLDKNGEVRGEIFSNLTNDAGVLEDYETGKYYGVIAGDTADEIVGVIVVESDDPRYDSVKTRETGGFIVGRK